MLRTSVLRAVGSLRPTLARTALPVVSTRQAHAISNPTLANIETRWEAMPPQEQADLWMALRDRMKTDWNELTMQEKKAAYWIAFGPHGPRREVPPGEGMRILRGTIIAVAVSGAIFYMTRLFAGPPPKTMSKEWQEKTNEYMKKQRAEPITGFGSMVQSPSTGLVIEEEDEEEEE